MIYLLLPSLFAFAPTPTQGIEPQRIYQHNPAYQSLLQKQPLWEDFVDNTNLEWNVRFDEATGYPLRATSKGIAFPNIVTTQDVLKQANQLIVDNPNLFHPKNHKNPSIAYNQTRQAYFVHYDQQVSLEHSIYNDVAQKEIQSVPVYRSGIDLFIDAQVQPASMTMFGVEYYDHLKFEGSYIQASDAIAIATQQDFLQHSPATDIDVELLFVPMDQRKENLKIPLCWKVSFRTQDPIGTWQFFIDIQTGKVHSYHNEIRFFTGSLHATYEERNLASNLITAPLEELKIPTDSGSIYTDVEGFFTIPDDSNIDADVLLRGLHTRIFNARGTEVILNIDRSEEIEENSSQIFDVESFLTETSDDEDRELVQSQLNQYMYQTHIYNWAANHAERVISNWPRSDVNVNLNDVCNAYYDGELNFFRKGEGCNNTGRIADVSYHEWGHGFHYHNLLSGVYDGAVSEGLSDVVAFLQTGDSKISPYFYTNGEHIRNVSENRVYPDDIINEVHIDGLIFAGAVWDLWNIFLEENLDNPSEGTNTLTRLFVEGTSMGPEIATSYEAFLFADDDDGDLSNGTPNQCLLIDAFGEHGLGPKGQSGFYQLEHTPIGNQPSSSAAIAIEATITQQAANCIEGEIAETKLFYRINQEDVWNTEDLNFTETSIQGSFPLIDDNTHVQYYIELTDTDGRIARIPSGGTINPFEFFVGELSEIYCNDFEDDDGGFGHMLVAGREREGADDWMRGILAGFGGDPEYAYSGDYVWGNDLGGEINGESYNGQYQNDKHNRLYTPIFDTSEYDHVVVGFQRWLHVEDGYYDQARILINQDMVWENHATRSEIGDEHHQDFQWQQQLIHLDHFDEISVSWEIESDAGLTMGGWTIDDFCIYGYNDPEKAEDPAEKGCNCSHATQNTNSSLLLLMFLGIFVQIRRRQNT